MTVNASSSHGDRWVEVETEDQWVYLRIYKNADDREYELIFDTTQALALSAELDLVIAAAAPEEHQ